MLDAPYQTCCVCGEGLKDCLQTTVMSECFHSDPACRQQIIVGKLKPTGLFEVMVGWALRMSRGRMWVLTTLLCIITAVLSAFLDNVTTMLLMSPMTIVMMKTVGRDPVPLLVLQVRSHLSLVWAG